MQIIADLHIHSRFSRACSKELTLSNIDRYCQEKGVDVVATGDFTYPVWFKELKEQLIEKEPGLYVLKSKIQNSKSEKQTRFICSTEISCIYSKGGKVRRLHIVVLMPNLEAVAKFNERLETTGVNLKSDGRPILGMDVIDLAKHAWIADPRAFIIPAHIWTPWFAMFGSKSGFDSMEECWGEMANQIFAIETGLSSDPPMNWRIKNLDRLSITSNSDAHSLPNIAREANVFEIDPAKLSYDEIIRVIKEKNPQEFICTVEFYPEEGMYHWDGHRVCNFSCMPSQSKKIKNICPVCKKPLTIGVMNRVEELADPARLENYQDPKRVPFKKLIELDKIIAEALDIKSRSSKRVQEEYKRLLNSFKNEFEILLKISEVDLKKVTLPEIVEGVMRMRAGKLKIVPGFDGQYGQIKIFDERERQNLQKSLF